MLPSSENIHSAALKRMELAWSSIRSENFLNKCKQHSVEEGTGMSIFRFLRPVDAAKYEDRQVNEGQRDYRVNEGQRDYRVNCEFYYAEKDSSPWLLVLNSLGENKDVYINKYLPETTFMVCVSVPEHEAGDSYIQEIKIFRYTDLTEV